MRCYASVLVDQGRAADAKALLDEALRLAPADAETLCDTAVMLSEGSAAEREAASGYYERCLAADAGHLRALFNYACWKLAHEQRWEAEKLLKQALAVDPHNLRINTEYACLISALDPDRARALFEAVLRRDGNNRRALLGLSSILSSSQGGPGAAGVARAGRGQTVGDEDGAAAEALLRRCVRLYPGDVDTLCHLAAFLTLRKSQHDEALHLYSCALAASPDCTAALCDKATLLRDVFNDVAQAERLYRQALDADPHHVPSLCGLSQLLMSAPREGAPGLPAQAAAETVEAEAESLLRRALSVEPDHADTLCMLGGLLRDKGAGWGGLDDGGIGGAEAQGKGGRGGGRTELARLMLDRALLVAPLHEAAHMNKAMLLSVEGDLAGAETNYKTVLRLNPSHVDALAGFAAILSVPPAGLPNATNEFIPGRRPSTADFVDTEEDQRIKNPLDAAMDERLRYADSLLERALQLAPSHVPALCGRGKVQCQLDNMTSAEMSFRAALKVAPHDWRSLSNYGVMLVSHIGDTQNGERLLERALAHAPNPSVARMLETLKTQTLQLGELRVPTLAKDPRQVRWEERDLNYQEARVPYDR